MHEYLKYICKGIIHYFNLLFELFDFIDLGTMYAIIGVILFTIIISVNVRNNILKLVSAGLNIIKTIPGLLFFLLFLLYYGYVFIFFQEKVVSIILLTIYLFLKTFFKINSDMIKQEKKSTWNTIKDISISVIILCIQQIVFMIENNNFNNIWHILLSLIIIPIFALLFFLNKHFSLFEVFYIRFKKMVDMDDYELNKIYIDTLEKCGSYELTDRILSMFILKNRNLTYNEMKIKLAKELDTLLIEVKPKNIIEFKNKNQVSNFVDRRTIIVNYFWLFNIIIFMISIMFKCYSAISLNSVYKISFIVLIIYLWCDLMKWRDIENQYNFAIYLVINIFVVFLLCRYSNSINASRLSEVGFMIPIFIWFKFRYFYKVFPSFLNLPYITDNNFFGLKCYDKANISYKK